MIVVDIMCGMGNQMFQYAFARAVQELYKEKKLYFSFVTAKRMKDGRTYALGHCKLTKDIVIKPQANQLIMDTYLKIKKKCVRDEGSNDDKKKLYEKFVRKGIYTSDAIFSFYGLPKTNRKLKYINGWWQSEKYFHNIADKIKQELKIVTPPSDANIELLREICSCESVCMHVRRGDYISPKFSTELEICNEKYYVEGMNFIAKKTKNPVFYVFTTSHKDIVWIKENWNLKFPVRFVDLDNPDYEEIRLMYTCKHFILANSTFSWWGAFLSENKEKIVIAPVPWNRRDKKYEDIYMENWNRIFCD